MGASVARICKGLVDCSVTKISILLTTERVLNGGMNGTVRAETWWLRLVAPLVWRDQRRTARELDALAATKTGSALDLFKAAELCGDPELRGLFFGHALDEARHAQ